MNAPGGPGVLDHLVVANAGLVRIRRKHPADARNDYAWRRDAELMRFDGSQPIERSFEEFAAGLESDIAFPRSDRQVFAIETGEGVHIGNCMFYNGDPVGGSAELGVSLAHPDYRDRGLGTATVIAFLRHLWSASAFRRIELHTLEWNVRAQRCFEKAGFGSRALVVRGDTRLVRMEARREWWLLWEMEGRFDFVPNVPCPAPAGSGKPA
ncbi:MAG: GNAT family N-acetyltransferase [Dehalococcoidia bacterium]|nr:GNAT family N-acetyltransferase [Dehalococcoidia bacterium]